ncbi:MULTISPECIES: putative periplasmic lipoprotein [Yersinia]|uniref:hypothetical protein n=1 Tax=Yersinia TaxID=629 RepID=UPI0005E4CEDB|nr:MULTISPECIES: hypothetical protein [Yersinia]PHZ21498.1 hypothetical protein CS535_22280 [Yersinia massiliensis]CNH88467.1 Uncharacterised protein [Yersinia massiliensis]CNJ95623.1 Uncharacterised protein [Yersinia frederiksenii]CQI99353.1 Uncharacterised protein [Yersinia frederiksenii]
MKRLFLLVAITALLSGCLTSPNEIRDTKPIISGHTTKSAHAYIGCVLNNWNEKELTDPVVAQPTANGYSAQVNDMARGVVVLLDVESDPSGGNNFKLYQKRDLYFYNAAVLSCK